MQRFQIHLITDRKRARGDLLRVVEEALSGGVNCVQAREKGGPASELYETARKLLPIAREAGASLLINDRVDVALASGADGVHLAAKSLPPRVARELLGERPLLGCSVHSLAEAFTRRWTRARITSPSGTSTRPRPSRECRRAGCESWPRSWSPSRCRSSPSAV